MDGPSTSRYIGSPIDGYPDPDPHQVPAEDPFVRDQIQSMRSARHQAQLLTNNAYCTAIGYLDKWETCVTAYQNLQLVHQELYQMHQNTLEDMEGHKRRYEETSDYKDKYEVSLANQAHLQAVIHNKDLSIDSLEAALQKEKDERNNIIQEYVTAKKRWEDEKKIYEDIEERQLRPSGEVSTSVVCLTKKRKIKSFEPDHDRFTELEYQLEEQQIQNRQLESALAETRALLDKSKKEQADRNKRLSNLDHFQSLPDRSRSSSTHSIRSDPYHIRGLTNSPIIWPSDVTPPCSFQKGVMSFQDLQGSEGICDSSRSATLGSGILQNEKNQVGEEGVWNEPRPTILHNLATPNSPDHGKAPILSSAIQPPNRRIASLESLNTELRKYAEDSQIRVTILREEMHQLEVRYQQQVMSLKKVHKADFLRVEEEKNKVQRELWDIKLACGGDIRKQ
ncbi:hypothetical protein V866_008579 [Kwoniella sp. B9012]